MSPERVYHRQKDRIAEIWKVSIKEQLEKILLLDDLILAELAADKKVSQEVPEEIEGSG